MSSLVLFIEPNAGSGLICMHTLYHKRASPHQADSDPKWHNITCYVIRCCVAERNKTVDRLSCWRYICFRVLNTCM